MVSVPVPRTWVDGEIPPWDVIKSSIYDTVSFLLNPPMVRLHQTSAQSIPNATYTVVTWNVEDIDPYGFHSPTVNPTRITPTVPGWYRGWMSCGFLDQVSTGDLRTVILSKNGARARARRDLKPSTHSQNRAPHGVPFFIDCNGTTDYLEMTVYQDSGAARALGTTVTIQPEFFMRWWGPL